ncbi:uncharacterized protein LOC110733787 [Chenopodium quinoa]|uniref:uncharacterized protein LOC110733787 n=1 Tax=Chenopodium quinoa TaxID=63459 RepID=UPI000B78963E|nr:uncharacterized protein LOC110733787 [Chenopodium quinoa]
MKNNRVQIKKIYDKIRAQGPKVSWKRIICNNNATPRSVFVLWLANWNMLLTKDRILKWNPVCDPVCLLYFNHEVDWEIKNYRRSNSNSKLHLTFLAEAVYNIWIQRNNTMFNGICEPADNVFRNVLFPECLALKASCVVVCLFCPAPLVWFSPPRG